MVGHSRMSGIFTAIVICRAFAETDWCSWSSVLSLRVLSLLSYLVSRVDKSMPLANLKCCQWYWSSSLATARYLLRTLRMIRNHYYGWRKRRNRRYGPKCSMSVNPGWIQNTQPNKVSAANEKSFGNLGIISICYQKNRSGLFRISGVPCTRWMRREKQQKAVTFVFPGSCDARSVPGKGLMLHFCPPDLESILGMDP